MYDKNYIITWAFGHLFSLCDIEDYLPSDKGRWTLDNIPCFPEKFEFKLKRDAADRENDGVKKQFETIKKLINREDVDTVVNAGDSDREGEIIVRICVDKAAQTKKTFKRLWLPDQTPETIKEALLNMKDEADYDNLANEGYARTFMDWLYGVNLTRYATLKTGTLLRVGRVIVPIVKAIYDRELAIRNFTPDIYYAVLSKEQTNGEEVELLSKEKFDKNNIKGAQALCGRYNAVDAVVTEKKVKKDSLKAGKLYSLTKLQNVLGKKYKMPMEESLKILQELYEKGYVTYPRTNSEYLAEAEKDKIKMILDGVKKLGYPVCFKDGKSIFDDSKIEAHSALTPTYKIPKKENLTEAEQKVYGTIMRRFVAVFCSEECEVQKQEIRISVGGLEEFLLKGTVILKAGWTKYDDYTKKDKILPKLEKGDKVNTNFKPVEKETNAPKHYTIETLNNYLKNPFREDKQNIDAKDDMEEYRAVFEGLELGTEATRTGIIENAIKSEYISLKKDVYGILPGGEFLIEALVRMGINMDKYKTAEFGKALKKVYRGEMAIGESVGLAKEEIKRVFDERNDATDDGFVGDVVGKCPLCGRAVARTRFGYSCTGYRVGCKFSVNNVILGKTISIENVKKLLETGESPKIDGFISKRTGKDFSAKLKLENGKAVFDFN